ncbi:hypothetical protein CC2G_007266 [Coprinopsis cinerea AmutBmut pab1-1]|nr:hypothetical protein CC2G_007266 [Coprinopsis cinerea AmutBmut pab1-1]
MVRGYSSGPDGHNQQQPQIQNAGQQPEPKRRPGRPRGSKNRKVRISQGGRDAAPPPSGPPPHPDINSSNQQYYEFQWRILNLCAEFYGAAEELVKGTNPLVIAQCYHMGPTSKVDPLIMLAEAKRICDGLLANPAQLVSNPHPPPPMYPVIPGLYPPPPPGVIPTATPGASTSKQPSAIPPATVITNPQSFVVPLGGQPGFPPPQYPVYGAGQYPTSPYYPFPFSQPYYSAQPPPASTSAAPSTNTPQPPATATPPTAVPAATSAPGTSTPTNSTWSEEDVEKLKKWAEESKGTTSTGEIDWDYVTRNFGDKRSRHQVLIKATALGLKESSTRGQKRRRDNEGGDAVMGSLPTQPSGSSSSGVQPVVGSPSLSQPASTPSASPAMQHQQRPPSAPATTPSAPGNAQITMTPTPGVTTNMPWPMPTVAAPTSTGGVLGSASTSQEPQRTSYYRPRPTQGDSAPKSASQQIHHYMYVPNGRGRDTG